MQRLFVSLDLPSVVKNVACEVQKRLRETRTRVSWTRPEGIHLTLKFLGDVEEGRVQEIQAALAEAGRGFRPITVKIEGIGGFPTLEAPRVLWLGIKEANGALARLQKRVDETLTPLGFPPEERDFHPHLTLGRVRSLKDRELLLRALKEVSSIQRGEWKLEELSLMQSVLQPGGAMYTKLWTMKCG